MNAGQDRPLTPRDHEGIGVIILIHLDLSGSNSHPAWSVSKRVFAPTDLDPLEISVGIPIGAGNANGLFTIVLGEANRGDHVATLFYENLAYGLDQACFILSQGS